MNEPAPTTPEVLFRTPSVDLAGYLSVTGFELLSAEVGEGGQVLFVFSDPNTRGEEASLHFFAGAQVPARAYADTLKGIRDLLWAKRRGNRGERKAGKDAEVQRRSSCD